MSFASTVESKIREEAILQGVDADLALAVAKHESRLDQSCRHTNTNGSIDIGIFQLNSVGIEWKAELAGMTDWNITIEEDNIKIGISYLKYCLERANGDVEKALTYYNRGNLKNGIATRYIRKIRSEME